MRDKNLQKIRELRKKLKIMEDEVEMWAKTACSERDAKEFFKKLVDTMNKKA